MPDELENLIEISRIKQLAKNKFVIKILSKRDSIVFTYDSKKFDVADVPNLIAKYGNKIKFSPGAKPMITLKSQENGERAILRAVKEFLK